MIDTYCYLLDFVMKERLAKNLGRVFEASSFKGERQKLFAVQNSHSSHEQQYDNDGSDDFDVALPPLWNVDIWRGAYFDFESVGKSQNVAASPLLTKNNSDLICPFPVVEFLPPHRSSRSSGRVSIRLQGYPVANEEFNGSQRSTKQQQRQPVSLVFDACIQNPTPVSNLVTSG